jgi:hypothetical protein
MSMARWGNRRAPAKADALFAVDDEDEPIDAGVTLELNGLRRGIVISNFHRLGGGHPPTRQCTLRSRALSCLLYRSD